MADLFHRVSIRKFKDETVSNEDIGYFCFGNKEYDYKIDASTGTILGFDYDI